MSEMLPNVGALADDICLVRSMHTESGMSFPDISRNFGLSSNRSTSDLHYENVARVTRRQLFGTATSGIGVAALASLLKHENLFAAAADQKLQRSAPGLPGLPHHAPKAKRVVVLWQGGGPSHVDLFDYKPAIDKHHGQELFKTYNDKTGKWSSGGFVKKTQRLTIWISASDT